MMGAMTSLQDAPAAPRSDRPRLALWQGGARRPEIGGAGDGRLWDWAQARRGLRLRTLVLLRWAAIAGQLAAVLWVAYGLHFRLPVAWCLLVIAGAGWMNLAVTLSWPGLRVAGEREAVLQLAFDIVELSLLLGLTGGLDNPFTLLLVAPVAVAAATLPERYAVALGVLALAATALLGLWSAPLPWGAGESFELPHVYRVGVGVAVAAGDRVHRGLRLAGRRRGPADGAGPRRHPGGAGARAAAVRARRAGGGGGA